ncbi:zinc-ribbon domain-containing protein [Lactonifactor longoviformis]|uniref:DUF7836 family putative zinc-binding protein n=1 Tax=Lactonifactor longoviformis TaxID=341220 RepID=UPI0036F378F0
MKAKITFQDWCVRNQEQQLLQFYQLGGNPIPADQLGSSAGKDITLQCPVCSLQWHTTPNHLTRPGRKYDCPYCSHRKASSFYNLAEAFPELLRYWDESRNTEPPTLYTPKSHASVHWRCRNGHTWTNIIKEQVRSAERCRKNGGEICPYCSGQRVCPTYNLEILYPDVAFQWNYVKNEGKKPSDFHPFSQEKVWWTCEFNPSHIWTDKISNRTALLRGCPQCSRQFRISYASRAIFYYLSQIFPGCACEVPFRDRYILDLLLPEEKIVIEHDGYYFHSSAAAEERARRKDFLVQKEGYRMIRIRDSKELTEGIHYADHVITYPWSEQDDYLDQGISYLLSLLTDIAVTPNHKKDHWEIERKYYHERKKRSLAVRYPQLAREWSQQNKEDPDTVPAGSGKKVWWKCPDCKREYEASVINRTQHGSGCSYCSNYKVCDSNSLAARRPEIAGEWNYEKNGSLTPEQVLPGTEKNVWWRCARGHEWPAMIYSRTGPRKSGCPYCSHRKTAPETSLASLNPDLASLWDTEKNHGLTPEDVTLKSNKPVWWKCPQHHSFLRSPNSLQKCLPENRCPECRKKNGQPSRPYLTSG